LWQDRDALKKETAPMNQPHNLVALITLLAIALYFWMGLRVGLGRRKFNVPAPAITGDPGFERRFRVQQNTLEWMVIFLPSLWLFALYWIDWIAAALGAVWIVGRLLYMFGYEAEAGRRHAGFGIQMLAATALLIGALAGVIRQIAVIGPM
jgi:glutathione S-transferase